ncbi:hypothetical protein CGZ93_00630 [Enemella dayhoffiae]|uniref:ESAT-6-like protein n=1 Tax=Enemella dayhoffiae TaxID=2016507 RepID=A0A255HBK7_9ACTN|nr:WXG100 family type VII secretion target [Enemella dayhoffiae]OYO25009.1 hypothetical protein CGZ93_00630 [Enemella dayhoffiae]
MGTHEVSASDLKQAAGEAEDYYGKIEKVQKNLYTQINGLMQGWKGDASRIFLTAFKEFDEEFSDVQNSLDNLHKKLGQTSLTYQQNEAEQSEVGRDLMNMINSKR